MRQSNPMTFARNAPSRVVMTLGGALLLAAALALPVAARDCRGEAQQEMDAINARAAAAKNNDSMPALCRGIAAQIRSYESIIALFRDPDCGASDPGAGIAQMTAKVEPLRTAYKQYCR